MFVVLSCIVTFNKFLLFFYFDFYHFWIDIDFGETICIGCWDQATPGVTLFELPIPYSYWENINDFMIIILQNDKRVVLGIGLIQLILLATFFFKLLIKPNTTHENKINEKHKFRVVTHIKWITSMVLNISWPVKSIFIHRIIKNTKTQFFNTSFIGILLCYD